MLTHGSLTTSTSFVDRLVELRFCALRFVAPHLALPLLSAPVRRASARSWLLRRPELPLLTAPAVAHFSKKHVSHNVDLGVGTPSLPQSLHKGSLAAAVNGIRVQVARRSYETEAMP